jgi:hypothetical protein
MILALAGQARSSRNAAARPPEERPRPSAVLAGCLRRIVEEAVQRDASLSEVARRYGIAARVLFRWKQELKPSAAPTFVTVQIADATAASDAALGDEERAP